METISVYEAIARNLGDIRAKGTPTGGTATGFDSNQFIHPLTKQLEGNSVYFYTGQGAGQGRTIIDFLPANSRVIVGPDFSTVPSADSRYIVTEHFGVDDYEGAMNRAMGKAQLINLQRKVATLAMVGTQYEYPVPSGFDYISTIRLVPSGSSDYDADDEVSRMFEFAPRLWRIESNPGGTYIIAFDRRKIDLDSYNNECVRIIGQAKPDFTATLIDSELEEYIIANASMMLASQRIDEKKEWQSKFYMFRDITNDLEPYIFRTRRGKRVE